MWFIDVTYESQMLSQPWHLSWQLLSAARTGALSRRGLGYLRISKSSCALPQVCCHWHITLQEAISFLLATIVTYSCHCMAPAHSYSNLLATAPLHKLSTSSTTVLFHCTSIHLFMLLRNAIILLTKLLPFFIVMLVFSRRYRTTAHRHRTPAIRCRTNKYCRNSSAHCEILS